MGKGKKSPLLFYGERTLFALLVVVVLLSLSTIVLRVRKENGGPIKEEPPQVRRALDGVFVPFGSGEGVRHPPFAGVMIENMVEAQPLSALADANLVFEAVAEANITRFLAFYTLEEGRMLPEIGPVRSARPYYLDFAREFNTLYAHVGSSPEAYRMLRQEGVPGLFDLDQWYYSQYFFAKPGRPRPHHFYTSSNLLRTAFTDAGVTASFEEWHFKDDERQEDRGTIASVAIGYQKPYDVLWQYDQASNRYERIQWGGTHRDGDGKAVQASNIAVAFQKMEIVDEIGRKRFQTTGEGQAYVFQDGHVIIGTWKKPTVRDRLRFYTRDGTEVSFNAGTTWVEIIPTGYAVTY